MNSHDSNNTDHACAYLTKAEYIEDTMLSWSTSIVIFDLALLVCLQQLFSPKIPRSESCTSKTLKEYLVPVIFLTFALMYGISGAAQSQAYWGEDSMLLFVFRIVSLSNGLFVVMLGLELMNVSFASRRKASKCLWWFMVISHSVVSITAAIQNFKLFGGNIDLSTMISKCSLAFLSTVCIVLTVKGKGKNYHFLVKALSVLVVFIGLGYDEIYFEQCQSFRAYQFCYEECSIPTDVNQKGYFNLATIVATIAWACSEHSCPSIVQKRNLSRDDDDTVESDDTSVASPQVASERGKEEGVTNESTSIDLESPGLEDIFRP